MRGAWQTFSVDQPIGKINGNTHTHKQNNTNIDKCYMSKTLQLNNCHNYIICRFNDISVFIYIIS